MVKRRVQELMNPDVVCLGPKTTIREAEGLLARRRVGGAPVVDESGRILGIVSQNDLVRFAAQRVTVEQSGRFFTDEDEYRDLGNLTADRSDLPVEQVMTRQVYTVARDAGVAIAANIMRERRVHRLLVTDKGRLVGIVTSLDLLRVVEEAI